ncbi:hypothetical protein E2C01_096386 [Portunus trituberculatus]|uniref:Uncharacterized protein n=1 Tax=Portunus trituberculatus TaxID=210409 RepID=A0A5B7JVH0_PORTR|nr:hypothetical protein [Portunus trituberculatus]
MTQTVAAAGPVCRRCCDSCSTGGTLLALVFPLCHRLTGSSEASATQRGSRSMGNPPLWLRKVAHLFPPSACVLTPVFCDECPKRSKVALISTMRGGERPDDGVSGGNFMSAR